MKDLSQNRAASSTELDFSLADFLAGDFLIRIVPSTHLPRMELITGTLGPFHLAIEADAPLYIGLLLKRQGKCALAPPEFLAPDHLSRLLADETDKDNAQQLAPLPSHFFAELALLFLTHAPDDLREPVKVRELLENLLNVRESKLRRFMNEGVTTRASAVRIPNLSSLDANRIRGVLTGALGMFHEIGAVQQANDGLEPSAQGTAGSWRASTQPTPVPVQRRTLRRAQ